MKRDAVDFHLVPEHQEAMHCRLQNWARAQRSPTGSGCSPMFRQYRSSDQWGAAVASSPVDQQDAAKINRGWQQLPGNQRAALAWNYVSPCNPIRARKNIGCTLDELAKYVIDGRQMLINRCI